MDGRRTAQKSHASQTYARTQYWYTGCIVLWFHWKPESYCVYARPGRTSDNSSFRSALTINQFAIMIHHCYQFGTNHSTSNSSIFTSRSRLVVNPLSGEAHQPAQRHSVAGAVAGEIYPARDRSRYLLVCAVRHDHASV